MSCPRQTYTYTYTQPQAYQYYYTTQYGQPQCGVQPEVVQQPGTFDAPAPEVKNDHGMFGVGYTWVKTTNTGCCDLRDRGIIAGNESDGKLIYIGRAQYGSEYGTELLPCKIIPDNEAAYVSFGLQEIPVTEFEMYCKAPELEWVECSDGDVPPGAIPFGKTSSGEILYVGRVNHEGAITPGKVHPSNKCLYIPYDCQELSFKNYEVLVQRH